MCINSFPNDLQSLIGLASNVWDTVMGGLLHHLDRTPDTPGTRMRDLRSVIEAP